MITKNGFILLNKFFAYDPKRRVTAEDALKHEYFEVNNNNNNNKIELIFSFSRFCFFVLFCLFYNNNNNKTA